MSEGIHRKLAAIVAADVVGYSRLMGEDEAGTLAALRHWRAELFEPVISSNNGAVVKNMGDGWLVEFDSAGDAVTCAIEVQEKLSDHEILKLRIGLHIGDIAHADDDIYGDGVNIAARLQEIAEPGAVVISDVTRRSIDGKLATGFSDLGQQELKNIAEPIAAFGWGMTAAPAAATQLPLPDKPSIAVLPFDNMSGDPEQEFFADGITEDIITALSHLRNIFVIARNSTFTFKGTATPILEVARILGVQYVIEGSVRKVGQRVRITVQLIDARRGVHIWADKFDRDLDDIFEIQDEITHRVAAITETQLILSEGAHVKGHSIRDVSLWEAMMRAKQLIYQLDQNSLEEAFEIASKVMEQTPDASSPYAYAAACHYHLGILGYSPSRRNALQTASELAQRSISLEEQDFYAHWIMCNICMTLRRTEEAVAHGSRALELNPNSSLALGSLGDALTYAGRAEEAIPKIESSIRINPLDPSIFFRLAGMAIACYAADRYSDAIEWSEKSIQRRDDWLIAHIAAVASQARLQNAAGAEQAVNRLQAFAPEISALRASRWLPFSHAEDTAQLADDLRQAGLPE